MNVEKLKEYTLLKQEKIAEYPFHGISAAS